MTHSFYSYIFTQEKRKNIFKVGMYTNIHTSGLFEIAKSGNNPKIYQQVNMYTNCGSLV
jgi:hypothetical protein